ncbi:hypothetical protein ACI65C_006242 [Semiaphis heraclei]
MGKDAKSEVILKEPAQAAKALLYRQKFNQRMMALATRHITERSNHGQSSSEKAKCSYLLNYTNGNGADQKHTVRSFLVSVAKPLGSIIPIDRSCMLECSCCNKIFRLEDTINIAQIKNPNLRKTCLENTTRLIEPNSCLCVGCYQVIEKRTFTKNHSKQYACLIMTCEQTACHIFNSKWLDKLKSTLLINKINLRVQNNEEEALHKIHFCNVHYDQILLITQCQLCGNRSMQKYELPEDIVHEYQLVFDEDNIPVTLKYGILICKPCHIYILLRRDKTTKITCELKKHCDATKTRILNKNKSKTKALEHIKLEENKINMGKKEEDHQLLTITSLPTSRSNIFTADYSSPSKLIYSVLALEAVTIPQPLINSSSLVASMKSLTKTIGTAQVIKDPPLTTTIEPIVKIPMTAPLMKTTYYDVKLSVTAGKSAFKRKRQRKIFDEKFFGPKTKKRVVNRMTVTTDFIKYSMSDHKSTISGIKPITKNDKYMTPVDKLTTKADKPVNPVNNFKIPDHKHLYKKILVFSPVLRPIFSSKWPVPKKPKKTSKSIPPAKKPTRRPTNLTLQNTFDSLSVVLPCTELNHHRNEPPKLFSVTLNMNQLFENLRFPVDKQTIANQKHLDNKSTFFSLSLRPLFSSKNTALKTNGKHQKSVLPIKNPTQLQTNLSYQDKLYSQSMSPCTEFPELSHRLVEPSALLSATLYMNQLFENLKVPDDKSIIPVDKSTIADHKPLDNKSPVLRPFFSSKSTALKTYGKSPKSVSQIKKPPQLLMNQSHPDTLDSRSISPRTEFSELSHHQSEPSILSSTTPDMDQLFEDFKVPVNKPTIPYHKPLDNKSPVLRSFFSSKSTALKTYGKSPKLVSQIKEPPQLLTHQSHQNMLDSRSMSPRTEFLEASHQRVDPTTLSSTTPGMDQLCEDFKVPVNKPTIADHKPLDNKSPVLRPFFSSKFTALKTYGKSPESVSPIKEPPQLLTNQSHQDTLDSRSISPRTEFSELSHHQSEPSILSSTTPDMDQLCEDFNVPVNKPTIADHKPLDNKSPVLRSFFSSKSTALKTYGKSPKSVSQIKKPPQLLMNQSHQDTLDSRSISPCTEFSELSHHQSEPSILSSTTPDMDQLFEDFKVPVNKPKIADHKPLDNKSPVSRPLFSSKSTALKTYGKSPKSVSPIKEPPQLLMNQSQQDTLDSRSISPRTEFSELSHRLVEPSALLSATLDINQLFENLKVPDDKSMIPVDKPTIADHKPLDNKSPVLRSFFSSKSTTLKTYGKSPKLVSQIKEPPQLLTNQSHQNMLDSRSMSPRTEFPEVSHQRVDPTTLSSTTQDVIQIFEKLKRPYSSGMEFINHLLNLETCRNLGTLIVENNKTTYRQRTSNSDTTHPNSILYPPKPKEYQAVSHINDDENDVTNDDYLSVKCVPTDDHNNSDSRFIPVKETSEYYNMSQMKSDLPKSFVNNPSHYYDGGDTKKHDIDLCKNSTVTNYPDITVIDTTSNIIMSNTITEASTTILSASLPNLSTIDEVTTTNKVPATVEIATVATNTSALITVVAESTTSITDFTKFKSDSSTSIAGSAKFISDSTKSIAESTTAIKNIEIPAITDTITINSDNLKITSMVNDNTTDSDATAIEEFATISNTTASTMITTVSSTTINAAVSDTIDTNSVTAITTTVTDDTTSVKIITKSSTITNEITTKTHSSAKCVDGFAKIIASTVTSDITTTTTNISKTTITETTISNASELTSSIKSVATIHPVQCMSAEGAMLSSYSNNKKFVCANSIEGIISDRSNISTPIQSDIVKAFTTKQLSLLSRKIRRKSTKAEHSLQLLNSKLLNTKEFKSDTIFVWKLRKRH